jgi:hypothetical protein
MKETLITHEQAAGYEFTHRIASHSCCRRGVKSLDSIVKGSTVTFVVKSGCTVLIDTDDLNAAVDSFNDARLG